MNINKMYIPNTEKWIHYYENLGKNGRNPYIDYAHRGGKQIGGGSLSGTSPQFITPIGPLHKGEHNKKVTVKLVSPVQQTIDQAKDEVERNQLQQGIKRKRSNKSVSSTRKRSRKQTSKVKKAKKKSTIKRLKKSNKKVVKKTVKSKSKKKISLKKKKLLKSSVKDIFSK